MCLPRSRRREGIRRTMTIEDVVRGFEDLSGDLHRIDCACVQDNPDACNCDMYGAKAFIRTAYQAGQEAERGKAIDFIKNMSFRDLLDSIEKMGKKATSTGAISQARLDGFQVARRIITAALTPPDGEGRGV